ncbi:MAG: glycosyltransferase [Cyclobacteriaceae bacterium]|nr:glycosyltransferase [Cyclobacteriaceae bacterium]
MSSQQPSISVFMLAYNHGPYIAQAIQSILDQKTDLDYELVIGEDCSTDNTRAVITSFKERYPEKIRVIENTTNVGMHENFLRTLFSCTGKYLCICEGDDYWEHPDKLNIQYQFLESHPDYVLVCGNHKKYIHNEKRFERGDSVSVKDHDISFEKLTRFNCITTATIMFRNVLKRSDFADDFYSIISCDWYMHMKLLNHGKIRYLNYVFAVYRINDGSINGRTNRLAIAKKEMDFLQLVKTGSLLALDNNKKEQLETSIIFKHYDLATAHALNRNRKEAIGLCLHAFKNRPFSKEGFVSLVKTSIQIISPGFFQALRSAKRKAVMAE